MLSTPVTAELLQSVTAASDSTSFLQRCQLVYEFFPDLNGIKFRDFSPAVAATRASVATDKALVRRIYASFLNEDAPSNALKPSMLDAQWAWFRWVQYQLLAALRMFHRYQGRIPDSPSPNVLLKAEHSMHDVEYVILASLAGGIATNDAEVEEDLRLVRPDGLVIRPTGSK